MIIIKPDGKHPEIVIKNSALIELYESHRDNMKDEQRLGQRFINVLAPGITFPELFQETNDVTVAEMIYDNFTILLGE